MGINIGSAFAKGIGIVGQNILDKQNKDRERRKNFEMYLAQLDASGQDAKSVMERHQKDIDSKEKIANARIVATNVKEKRNLAMKPQISFTGYTVNGKKIKSQIKLLTGTTSTDRQSEEYQNALEFYSPALSNLANNKNGVEEFTKLISLDEANRLKFDTILTNHVNNETANLKKNSDGKTVVPNPAVMFSNPIVRNYYIKNLAGSQAQNQDPDLQQVSNQIKDVVEIPLNYTVAGNNYGPLLPAKYKKDILSGITNNKVQQVLNNFSGDPNDFPDLIEQVTAHMPENFKNKSFKEKYDIVARISINSQRDKIIDPISRTVNFTGRPKISKDAVSNKVMAASKNVEDAAIQIGKSVNDGALLGDASMFAVAKTSGLVLLLQETGGLVGDIFEQLTNSPASGITKDLNNQLTDSAFDTLDKEYTVTLADGTKQTRQIDESSRNKIKTLINNEKKQLIKLREEYEKTEDVDLQKKLEATYNLHMNKVLLVFSYARLLQAGDPRISNQDFVFVSQALFPNIGLTVEGQKEALLNGMARLHSIASVARIEANFDKEFSIVRPGTTTALNYGANNKIIDAQRKYIVGNRKTIAQNNPREYMKKYMGITFTDESDSANKTSKGTVYSVGPSAGVMPTANEFATNLDQDTSNTKKDNKSTFDF